MRYCGGVLCVYSKIYFLPSKICVNFVFLYFWCQKVGDLDTQDVLFALDANGRPKYVERERLN